MNTFRLYPLLGLDSVGVYIVGFNLNNKCIRMKLKIVFLLAASLFFSAAGDAQETWTLERCIEYALSNNITIKQQGLNVSNAENTLRQSQWSQTPTISGSGSQSLSFGRSRDNSNFSAVDKNSWSGSFGVGSQVELFGGLNKRNTIAKNKLDLQSALLDVEKTRNDVSLNVVASYLQVLFNEEQVLISQRQVELTKSQVERTQKLVDAGNLSQSNLLEIRSQQAQEEVALVNAQNQLDIAYLTLKQLLELSADTQFKIDHPSNIPMNEQYVLASPGSLFESSLGLPQIKSAEVKVESAERGVKVAQSGYYPTLSFSAQYGTSFFNQAQELKSMTTDASGNPVAIYGKQAISDQLRKNQTTNLGLNLSIPIFSSFRNKYSVNNARIGYTAAQLNLQQQRNVLYKEIAQAHADAVGALKKFHATQKARDAFAETFTNADKKFNVGAANSLDYNTAKNNLSKSESDLLQAKYEFIFKTKILDFYKGIPIKL